MSQSQSIQYRTVNGRRFVVKVLPPALSCNSSEDVWTIGQAARLVAAEPSLILPSVDYEPGAHWNSDARKVNWPSAGSWPE